MPQQVTLMITWTHFFHASKTPNPEIQLFYSSDFRHKHWHFQSKPFTHELTKVINWISHSSWHRTCHINPWIKWNAKKTQTNQTKSSTSSLAQLFWNFILHLQTLHLEQPANVTQEMSAMLYHQTFSCFITSFWTDSNGIK